jgi:DNA-binding transcriptional MerR regulator
MVSPTVAPPPRERGGVPIAEVSRLLGVPMPTLRSWEARYNLPAGPRVRGRHRRYQPAELHELRLMRDQVARGVQAGAAAEAVRTMLNQTGAAVPLLHAFLQASEQSDPGMVGAVLDQARDVLGLAVCFDEVLLPGMQQIGSWWESGRCDIRQEHLTTEIVRAWLEKLASVAPAATQRRPLILACGPTDLHTIGLEALGVLLRYRHWNCRMLGARTSTLTLTTAIDANDAIGVVLVSHLGSGRQRAIQSVRAVASLGTPIFYAGNAFASARSRYGLPGHYLGSHLDDACVLIDSELRQPD